MQQGGVSFGCHMHNETIRCERDRQEGCGAACPFLRIESGAVPKLRKFRAL